MTLLQSLLQISDQAFYLFQAVLSVSLNEFVSWMLEAGVNLSHS